MRASLVAGLGAGLAVALAWGPLEAQPPGMARPPQLSRDSLRVPAPKSAAVPSAPDSARPAFPAPSSVPKADSLANRPKSRSDSVIVVKHRFNHKEQIITGSVIMTCLALMLVAMNNYNPR